MTLRTLGTNVAALNNAYVGRGQGSAPSTLAPRYVHTLATQLTTDSPANLRTGLSTATYTDGGFQVEMSLAVTGTKGSAVLTSTDTAKVAGLGANKFAAVLNSTDGLTDIFVTVLSNDGASQITLRTALDAGFTGTLSAKYEAALGQHLTRAATRALAQVVANESGLFSTRGAVLEGTWDSRPNTYNTAWAKNAALIAYGVSNSASPVVQSELDLPVGQNMFSTDRLPFLPNALNGSVRVGTHLAGHGATATLYPGHRDTVLEFFTGTYRTTTSMAAASLTVTVTVDGTVFSTQTVDGWLNRIRVPLHRADKVTVDVVNASGTICYLMLSQLTLREAGIGATLKNQNLKIVTFMDSWGSRYQAAFSQYLAAKTGATVVDHSLGGTTSKWALDYFATSVLPEKPDVCVMDFAINDANHLSGVNYTAPDGSTKAMWPSGTTAAQDKALWRTNMQQLAALCRANNIQPLFIVQSGTAADGQTQTLSEWAAYLDQPTPAYPVTSTELADTAAYVNTVGKVTGKTVVVGTSTKTAGGPLAADAWANLAEDALVAVQKKSLSRASYAMATGVVIGTDTNADGLSDGFTTTGYGTATGDTFTFSVVGGNQRYVAAYGSTANGNTRLKMSFSATSGKDYLVVFDVINATASANLTDSVSDILGGQWTLSTNGSVAIDGTGAGVVCYRATASATATKYAAIAPARANSATRTYDVRKAFVIDVAALLADAPNLKNLTVLQLATFTRDMAA